MIRIGISRINDTKVRKIRIPNESTTIVTKVNNNDCRSILALQITKRMIVLQTITKSGALSCENNDKRKS